MATFISLDEMAERLGVSRSTLERLIPKGLPHLDLAGPGRPGRRHKRLIRLDPSVVVAWLGERNEG